MDDFGLKGKTSRSERIKRVLRRRIVDGTYPPHTYLPPERALASELSTSRVTVAAALRELQEDGLVVRHRGRGTRVLPAFAHAEKAGIGILVDVALRDRPELRGAMACLDGARATLTRSACSFEVISSQNSVEMSDKSIEAIWSRFKAIILIGLPIDPDTLADQIARRPIPLVIAKLEENVGLDVSATWVDHREPVLKAVHTLTAMRHRRIAIITREPEFAFYERALDGYKAGLAEAGLPFDESLLAQARKTDALSGYFAARELLKDPEKRPTAIIACRDTLAEGAYHAIEEMGLSLGHDVSLIGFDDMTWPREDPILTTFREPCYEMGAAAAEMLLERIVDPSLPPERRKFETPFVLRSSVGPPI